MRGNDLEAFCGTNGGFAAHQKRNEPSCEECRHAHAVYRRRLRASKTPPPLDPMSELVGPDLDLPGRKPSPGNWARDAACLDKPEHWWFPESDLYVPPEAAAICAVCPVQPECLEHAVRVGEDHGIWGGRSPVQRRRLRRGAKRGAA